MTDGAGAAGHVCDMAAKRPSPLWKCPRCGLQFVNKNQWHSCGQKTLAQWKKEMSPCVRRLFDRFESMIAACGEYHVSPAKTRISFLARVRFAGVYHISERGLTCAFALPFALDSPRLDRVQEVAPGWFEHRIRIVQLKQLDRQLQRWLQQSYQRMGTQAIRRIRR